MYVKSSPYAGPPSVFCALTWRVVDIGVDGGAARVDGNFGNYLRTEFMKHSNKVDIPDILADANRDFKERCRRIFTTPSTSYSVYVGSRSMNISALQITKGILTLAG
jgi:hypothetical protein